MLAHEQNKQVKRSRDEMEIAKGACTEVGPASESRWLFIDSGPWAVKGKSSALWEGKPSTPELEYYSAASSNRLQFPFWSALSLTASLNSISHQGWWQVSASLYWFQLGSQQLTTCIFNLDGSCASVKSCINNTSNEFSSAAVFLWAQRMPWRGQKMCIQNHWKSSLFLPPSRSCLAAMFLF